MDRNMEVSHNPEETKESRIWMEALRVLELVEKAMLKKVGSIMPGTTGYDLDNLQKSVYSLFAMFQEDWFKDQVTNTTYDELYVPGFKEMISDQVKHLANATVEQGCVYGGNYLASLIDGVLDGIE